MLHLLALLSCQSFTQAKTLAIPDVEPPPEPAAEPAFVRLPEGQPIVRECYASAASSWRNRGAPSTGGAPTTPSKMSPRSSSSASAPPPAPPATPVAQAPSAVSAPAGGFGLGNSGSGGSPGGLGASTGTVERGEVSDAGPRAASRAAPTKPAERAAQGVAESSAPDARPSAEPSMPAMDALAANGVSDDEGDAVREPQGRVGGKSEAKKADKDTRAQEKGWAGEEEAPRFDANLDWGAKVYLSNDDSMSLASAQRLLWAIQNKGAVTPSQVRPHELLNYFSFESAPVANGMLFSVQGSAEQTASGVVTLSFAVKGATPPREPLDLTMVLDRSGSMSAEGRMDYLKRGLTKMTAQLVRGDRVDLVLFDDQVCTPLENYVVGRDDPALLSDAISKLAPRGSTDLDVGLEEGFRIANARNGADVAGRNRRMMLISDALLNTGDIDPNTVTEVAKAYERSGIRLTAVGVGRDFNDKVLDMLSEKGKGAYVYLGSEAVVDRVFGVGFGSLVQTIAHDVRFSLDLPPSLAMKKFYGEESSTDPKDIQPIHYYAGTTQLFLQDLQMAGGRPVGSDPVTLTIEYTDAETGRTSNQAYHTTVGALLESDPRNLRKARTLMAWTDMIQTKALGGSPCGAPFATWQERVATLGEDAEVQWLDGLTSPLCGSTPKPLPAVARGVAYKVKVDSDLPIAEVGLTCSGRTVTESLSGSDTVARFDAAVPGRCTLMLLGNVPMQTRVEVPTTGGEIRCTVRAGRMSCG